ncbi:hypothetical protein K2Z83_20700 [Oscillochloris sp. ZM17-4]|uniref:zinc finger domain-containing protein n=1 Tax=Oscillochloris sp. ZM17-4 TaxID=2866714 RepID=UPI001C733368|nr:hypothetical protein [Oscillochloris sp. ZM17-4]MBX0330091.1 hypothetical protein [Oscillochloris sp. ZM17-4]
MSVTCLTCGQEWPRDPVLEVVCPTCHAAVGSHCKRPSGHEASDVHAERDRLAMRTIAGYGQCPTIPPTNEPRAAPQQLALHF